MVSDAIKFMGSMVQINSGIYSKPVDKFRILKVEENKKKRIQVVFFQKI